MNTKEAIVKIDFPSAARFYTAYDSLPSNKKPVFERAVWTVWDALYAIQVQELIWTEIVMETFSPTKDTVTLADVPEHLRQKFITRAEVEMQHHAGQISPKITQMGNIRLTKILER